MQSTTSGSPLEKILEKRQLEQLCDDNHDLTLTVENGAIQPNERHDSATDIEESGEQRPHELFSRSMEQKENIIVFVCTYSDYILTLHFI
jgi:hypothetical protein